MALLERVSTLVRANLNDLIDKAEDPEKMIKQVILDMQNQLLQVKTQVAIAIADQHLLAKKQKENEEKNAEWVRKAELAVDKKQDDLARGALERSLSYKALAESFAQQVADQTVQVENLKIRAAQAGAEADRGSSQERRSDRAASSRARVEQGRRRPHGHREQFQLRRVRPHEEQSAAQRSAQPGQGRADRRFHGRSTGVARKTG